MNQISTLEINNNGDVLSVSSTESSFLYDMLSTVGGGNITESWDGHANAEMKKYLGRIFSTFQTVEFLVTLRNYSLQCIAHQYSANKAFLHFKVIEEIVLGSNDKSTKKYRVDIKKKGQLFDSILMEASTPIHFVAMDGRVIAFNYSASELLGYTKKEYERLTVYDIMPKYTKAIWRQKCVDYALSGSQTFQEVIRKKDGNYIDVQVNTNILMYGETEVVYCCFTDLTEKKKLDEKMKLVDFSFRDTATAICFLREDGTYYDANEAMSNLLGYTMEEFMALEIFDINPNIDKEYWAVIWGRQKGSGTRTIQTTLKKKDGSIIDVEIKSKLINYGGLQLNSAFITDITEKKRLEEQLKLIEFSFRNSATPIVYIKEDASIYDCNEIYIKTFGYSKEELKTLKIHDLNPYFNKEKWALHWQELKETDSLTFITRRYKKDGTPVDIEVRANLIKHGGTELNCAFITDITEKLKAEKKLKFVDFSFRNAYIPIYLIRKDATFYDFNDAAHTLLGYTREEMSKKRIYEIDENYNTPEIWRKKWDTIGDTETKTIFTKHIKKDGSLLDVEIRAKLMIFNGHEYQCFFVTDITGVNKFFA